MFEGTSVGLEVHARNVPAAHWIPKQGNPAPQTHTGLNRDSGMDRFPARSGESSYRGRPHRIRFGPEPERGRVSRRGLGSVQPQRPSGTGRRAIPAMPCLWSGCPS